MHDGNGTHDSDGTPQADELTVLLRGLVAEAPTALPAPYELLRSRGRARRRRRRTVLAAFCTALAVSGGVLLLPHAAGPDQLSSRPVPTVTTGPVTPSQVPTVPEPAPVEPAPVETGPTLEAPAPEDPEPTPLPSGQVRAVVDLSATDLVVNGTGSTRECSVGAPGRRTPQGRMTVISRQPVVVMDRDAGPFVTTPGETWYHLDIKWAIRLALPDGTSTWVAAAPEDTGVGLAGTGRDIGLRTEDAHWFYERVAVGDTVEIRA